MSKSPAPASGGQAPPLPLHAGTRSLVLSRWASFWVAAAVVAHTLWTSAAPAVTYPLYAAQWHLSTVVTTAIFAIYPIAVVLVLLLFGNLSDHVGRRLAILLGLAASLLGVLLFAVAPSVAWLFAGRVLMGVGVGLSASPAAAALVDYSAPGQAGRAGVVATAATAAGLALATLVGGVLIQYAPWPTHLNFWLLSAVLAVLLVVSWFLPRHAPGAAATRWRPGKLVVPRGTGRVFAVSTIAISTAYALGAMVLSLGAQIARELIGSGNALVNGAAIALFAVVTGVLAVLAKRLPAPTSIMAGSLACAISMGLLMLSAAQHALPLFLAAVAMAGAAYSLLFLGGLTQINAHAPAHQRAGTLSAIYLIAYLMMGAVALLLGAAATAWGLEHAIDVGGPAVALLGAAGGLLVALGGRQTGPGPMSAPVSMTMPAPLVACKAP